jgi:hypothetical protein
VNFGRFFSELKSHNVYEAIALISGLLKSRSSFTTVTPTMLRLAPTWDLLRDDPRFQALLKEYPAELR